jgi:hypothetical protein
LEFNSKPVLVHVVILLAGLIAYMGCTGATTSGRAAPQATLNPDSALPVLVMGLTTGSIRLLSRLKPVSGSVLPSILKICPGCWPIYYAVLWLK